MPELTLQPDEASANDAFVLNANPTTNFGSHGNLWVGERALFSQIAHTLLKFDLTTLPADATIVSATLSLWLSSTAQASQGDTIKVYRLKRAWVESEVTWNVYSTGNSWQVAGGDGPDDREQTEIGSADTTGSDPTGQFFDIPLTPTSKADLDLGYGWLLRTVNQVDDLYIFYPSTNATPSQRPKLTIVYTMEAGNQPYSFIM